MYMRHCAPGCTRCIPPSLCDTSAPRDTVSRCARNTEYCTRLYYVVQLLARAASIWYTIGQL
eukprot:3881641-Prymnesium_polylepis.1